MEYLDTRLIECNRAQASSKSEDNFANWTNTLNETVQLQAGDKISIHAGYIAERGADASQSVEFDGQPTGKTKKIKYTNIARQEYFVPATTDTDYPVTEVASTVEETIDILDNQASIVINYYKTMDGNGYNQLPRRFMPFAVPSPPNNWSILDSVANGRPHIDPYPIGAADPFGIGSGCILDDMRPFYEDDASSFPTLSIRHWIQHNDNTRYTLMIRKQTLLPVGPNTLAQDLATRFNAAKEYYPEYWQRDPEQFDYITYREKLDLKIEQGFASSFFVANEITRQLRQAKLDQPKIFRTTAYHRKIDSTVYKTFNAGNTLYQTEPVYDRCLNNGGAGAGDPGTNGPTLMQQLGSGKWEVTDANDNTIQVAGYYKVHQYIAVKRPELYEKGCEMNSIQGLSMAGLDDGSQTFNPAFFTQGGLVIDLEYTQDNCKRLLNFLQEQAKYPELFAPHNIANLSPAATNIYGIFPTDPTDSFGADESFGFYDQFQSFINVNNSRFFHMNIAANLKTSGLLYNDLLATPVLIQSLAQLGCSYYDMRGTHLDGAGVVQYNRTLTEECHSKPFFFHYDPTQKDTFYDEPSDRIIPTNVEPKLSYGMFGKSVALGGDFLNRIVIYPNLLKDAGGNALGMPSYFFSEDGNTTIHSMRKLGFDRHWNAWSTCAIQLQDGVPLSGTGVGTGAGKFPDEFDRGQANLTGIAAPIENNTLTYPSIVQMANFNNKIYLGADAAALSFDGNHFAFENLHTPLNRGDLENNEVVGDAQTGGQTCYKMNPRENYANWNTSRLPYNEGIPFKYATDPGSADDRLWIRLNRNMTPFAIYDTSTGIFIEDLGYDADQWEDGLWNKLGFEYEQFNSGADASDRNTFIDSSVKNTNILTTNAEINAVDTKSWAQNQYLNAKFNGDLCASGTIYLTHISGGGGSTRTADLLPVIIQTGIQSVTRTANDYPIALNQGYYTIRSDIVPQHSYAGAQQGNTALPIVGLISKQNPASDYYFAGQNSVEHIITKPTTISSIQVSVTDPDGTFANISKRSAVIFRVDRTSRLDLQVAKEVFEKALRSQKGRNKM